MDAGSESNAAHIPPRGVGPVLTTSPILPAAIPSTIAGGGSYQSGIIYSDGYKSISVGAKLSQVGSITIQRYLDAAGTIPVGAPITAALAANTANWATVNDGVAFLSFQVTIANTSGSIGNLSNTGILLAAA